MTARQVVLSALLLLASGCAGEPPGRTFLLLTVDTLRADRLGAYGYPRGTSPAMDRVAARSALFADCVSVSSWTMPAMGTLATGLRPGKHGMVYWHLPLGDVPETMAEALRDAGVKTAFFGNPIPRLEGLERGFDTWETFEGDDRAATDAAIAWLDEAGGDRFVWVHLLSPHAPYDPLPGTARPDAELDPRTVDYDAEVRTVDLHVEALLKAVGPDAAAVLTADHGETLDERAELEYDHGKVLFEELLHVPLAVVVPGAGASVVTATVTIADVPVTICDWFGLEPPRGSYGLSLLPARNGDGPAARSPVFAWVVEDEPPQRKDMRWAIRSGTRKAIFNVDRGTAQLFDLDADPGETVDLAGANAAADEVQAFRDVLDTWRAAHPEPAIPFGRRFRPTELERLQSLGYLGGAGN